MSDAVSHTDPEEILTFVRYLFNPPWSFSPVNYSPILPLLGILRECQRQRKHHWIVSTVGKLGFSSLRYLVFLQPAGRRLALFAAGTGVINHNSAGQNVANLCAAIGKLDNPYSDKLTVVVTKQLGHAHKIALSSSETDAPSQESSALLPQHFLDLDNDKAIAMENSESIITVEPIALFMQTFKFFGTLFNGGAGCTTTCWAEHQDKVVLLTETNPFHWHLLMDWIIPTSKSKLLFTLPLHEAEIAEYELFGKGYVIKQGGNEGLIENNNILVLDRLVELYILCDFLGAPELQNEIMDEIMRRYNGISKMTNVPTPVHNILYITDSLSSTSPLRRLVIDLMVYVLNDRTRDALAQSGMIDKETAGLVAERRRVLERRYKWADDLASAASPFERCPCSYHIHRTEQSKSRCEGTNWRVRHGLRPWRWH